MEEKNLLDISIKYGLNSFQVSKLEDVFYQADIQTSNSRDVLKISKYICENNLLEMPTGKLLEELKRKKMINE